MFDVIKEWSIVALGCLSIASSGCASDPGPAGEASGIGADAAVDRNVDSQHEAAGDAPSQVDQGTLPTCTNLECKQVSCDGGGTTSLSGKVVAPTKVNADGLPGVTVYVPNGDVEPFGKGVACGPCDAPLSGSPLIATTSAVDGSFRLENVPVGNDIPLVIQSGRWRRQVKVDVQACTDNPVSTDLTHLPRNKAQGDIPLMALSTGYFDALECTLAKLLDAAELTAPTGDGRVHLYRADGKDASPSLPPATELWTDKEVLLQYDAVLLACGNQGVTAQGALHFREYADRGGRLYLTHGGGSWLASGPEPFPGLIGFGAGPDPQGDHTCSIETGFPKGKLFADWLFEHGVSTTLGKLTVNTPQHYVAAVYPPAQRWVFEDEAPHFVQHLTFNTPLESASDGGTDTGADADSGPWGACGRVMYTLFHADGVHNQGGVFPSSCGSDPALTAQEKIVEFSLFDSTACVRPDHEVPK
jgi:hypothetical protein